MRRWARRAVGAVLLCTTAVAVSGCTSGSNGGAAVDGCSPRWPQVSSDVVRPGDTVTVSVSAATCAPRFDTADRALELIWVDEARHRTRLATVRAHPSGAFERDVEIPRAAATGFGELFVTGIDIPCGDTASCAAYEAGLEVSEGDPDFGHAGAANGVAAGLARQVRRSLAHRPSFVEVAIVADGIEVWMHTTHYDRETTAAKVAFVEAQTDVPSDTASIADAARLHIDFVQHDRREIARLMSRIANDRVWRERHGVDLISAFPDPATDSVRIDLRQYDDDVATRLARRYGDGVTISARDTPPAVPLADSSVKET